MRVLLLGLVFVSPPFLKNLLLKWFCQAEIGHQAQIGWFSAVMARHIALGEYSAIRPFTLVKLNGDFRLGDHSEISSFNLVYGSSSLLIGDYSYVGPQSLINADEPVKMGSGSALGPRSMIFTHGSFLPHTEGYWIKLAGVTIRDKVWCAAGVFLHPGVEIGEDSFVNSKSVVTQSIPPGSVVEGNPAKVIYPMARVKRNMSPRRVDAVIRQILRDFAEIGLRRELGLTEIEETELALRFEWGGQRYYIQLIPSTGGPDGGGHLRADERQILILNDPAWSPPSNAMIFEMATMQTRFVTDQIHTALRQFMQRYHGVRFSDTH